MKRILVLCTGNSCRSQMAEGYLRRYAGDSAQVFSAGLEAHGVNEKAIAIMKEDGIDIAGQTSDRIETYLNVKFDYIITVCDNANENCPVFPGGGSRIHQDFPDPAKAIGTPSEILNQFRSVRNAIRDFCKKFVATHLPQA